MLSICIPTWNRADTLSVLLSSIAPQMRQDVEVIVVDNASTDGTNAVMRIHGTLIQNLRYVKQRRNIGLDANLRTCAEQATGSHLWIVGSDDILNPGAVSRVLDTIQACPSAMILGQRTTIDHQRHPIKTERFVNCEDWSLFWLDAPGDVARYLAKAESICAAFSFLSSTIMPAKYWPADAEDWEGTYYTQTYAAWNAALAGCPVVIRQLPLVLCRVGNHGRRNTETAAHVMLDVETFRRIARLATDPADAAAIRSVLRHEYGPERLASLDQRLARDPSWRFIREALASTCSEV